MASVTRFIEIYLSGLERGKEFSRRSQDHEDTTLTWALALMGGALLALPSSLQALGLDLASARRWYLLACAPWVLGSITAVLGRFCYRSLRNADDHFTFVKTAHMTEVLLRPDPEAAGEDVQRIARDEVGNLGGYKGVVRVWRRRSSLFFYATHILLVLGFLSISAFILWRTLCPPVVRAVTGI